MTLCPISIPIVLTYWGGIRLILTQSSPSASTGEFFSSFGYFFIFSIKCYWLMSSGLMRNISTKSPAEAIHLIVNNDVRRHILIVSQKGWKVRIQVELCWESLCSRERKRLSGGVDGLEQASFTSAVRLYLASHILRVVNKPNYKDIVDILSGLFFHSSACGNTLFLGEGATWCSMREAGGRTHDAHLLTGNSVEYQLCYPHTGAVAHHTHTLCKRADILKTGRCSIWPHVH